MCVFLLIIYFIYSNMYITSKTQIKIYMSLDIFLHFPSSHLKADTGGGSNLLFCMLIRVIYFIQHSPNHCIPTKLNNIKLQAQFLKFQLAPTVSIISFFSLFLFFYFFQLTHLVSSCCIFYTSLGSEIHNRLGNINTNE